MGNSPSHSAQVCHPESDLAHILFPKLALEVNRFSVLSENITISGGVSMYRHEGKATAIFLPNAARQERNDEGGLQSFSHHRRILTDVLAYLVKGFRSESILSYPAEVCHRERSDTCLANGSNLPPAWPLLSGLIDGCWSTR